MNHSLLWGLPCCQKKKLIFCFQQGGRRLSLPLLLASHVGADVQGAFTRFKSISDVDILQGSAGIDDFPIWVQLIPRFLFRPLPISSHMAVDIDSILQGDLQCDLQQNARGLHHPRVFAQLLREFLRPRRRQFGKSGHRGVQVHVSGEFNHSLLYLFILNF